MKSEHLLGFCLLLILGPAPALAQLDQPAEARITSGSFKKELILNGQVAAARSTKFRTPRTTSWRVDIVWMAPEGAMVQPGDPVLRFQNSEIIEEIEKKDEELIDQYAALKEEETRSAQDTVEYAEKTALAEIEFKKAELDAAVPKSLLTGKDYQENQLKLVEARLKLKKARAEQQDQTAIGKNRKKIVLQRISGIEQQRARYQQMLTRVEFNTDTAGVVLYEDKQDENRKWQVGDTATISESILFIPDMESLRVHAHVDEARLKWLHPGQTASLRLDAFPDKVYAGVVAGIANTGTKKPSWGKAPYFEVILEFQEKDLGLMKPGMSVACEIEVLNRNDLLLAPITHVGQGPTDYLLQPRGKEPVSFEPVAFNAFQVAFVEKADLQEGVILQPCNDLSPSLEPNHEEDLQ